MRCIGTPAVRKAASMYASAKPTKGTLGLRGVRGSAVVTIGSPTIGRRPAV